MQDVQHSVCPPERLAWLDVGGTAPTHTLNSLHWVFASQLISEGGVDCRAAVLWAVMCWAILSSDYHSHKQNGSGLEIDLTLM